MLKDLVKKRGMERDFLISSSATSAEEIADPWYTGDFERTYADILEGCTGFLRQLEGQGT